MKKNQKRNLIGKIGIYDSGKGFIFFRGLI